jgi:outer membrane receptor protein involved in Fe transport
MQNRNFTIFWLFIIAMMATTAHLSAQFSISGNVRNSAGEPLIGAFIQEEGTNNGTTTDLNGDFSLTVRNGQSVILVTYIGFKSKKIQIGGNSKTDIVLDEDAVGLTEVTVTALGIKREKKALGYAVQDVNGEDLIKARDANLLNGLSGKVAGVTIVGNPSGIGGSARVSIRGERSLNINNNQPLFVIDGVPVSRKWITGTVQVLSIQMI